MSHALPSIPDHAIPQAADPLFQHLLDTYASETNKLIEVWKRFEDSDLGYRPHPKSTTVEDILKHQLLSERRFFGEFLGTEETPADQLLPAQASVANYVRREEELALPRLARLAVHNTQWWQETVPFFDVERSRIWVFWRRVLHTAHHRTQLTVYLRLLHRPVPAVYGPSADETWEGADPTQTIDAASRRGR